MRRIKIVVSYDGTDYYGWQRQAEGMITIQEVLEKTISEILDEEITVVGSGRTDAGVHALAQVAHFDTTSKLPTDVMLKAFNAKLPRSIVVRNVQEVDTSFHARFSAKSRTYKYFISHLNIPFFRRYSWFIKKELDYRTMEEAANLFVGEHDFNAFGSPMKPTGSTVRVVYKLTLRKRKFYTVITITANSFLRKMVRNIVGVLVAVGESKIEPNAIERALKTGKKEFHHKIAPPEGLFLWKVNY